MLRKILLPVFFTLALLAGGVGLASTAHAYSNQPEFCSVDQNFNPYECLNAWNGGPYVASYQWSSADNNDWTFQGVYNRCQAGSDRTTTNCPFNGARAGLLMFQWVFNVTGQCMGTVTAGGPHFAQGVLTGCNGSNGYGGGIGTVQVAFNYTCPSGTSLDYNSYWSNSLGSPVGTIINSSNGDAVWMDSGTATCNGAFQF